MNIIETVLTTTVIMDDSGGMRYLLKKRWDDKKPKLAIIMLAPSISSGVAIDATTRLCIENAERLGYGSIAIVNLFATVNDFSLKQAEGEDSENLDAIVQACQEADTIVYAPGTGKAGNKSLQKRQQQVLNALRPMEGKLNCLCDADGNARLQHPLSPAVRTWHLSPLKVSELLPPMEEVQPVQKKTAKGKSKASEEKQE